VTCFSLVRTLRQFDLGQKFEISVTCCKNRKATAYSASIHFADDWPLAATNFNYSGLSPQTSSLHKKPSANARGYIPRKRSANPCWMNLILYKINGDMGTRVSKIRVNKQITNTLR
jgi:hypothetical protein